MANNTTDPARNNVSVDMVERDGHHLVVDVSIEVPDALYQEVQREADYRRAMTGDLQPIEHYLLDRITIRPQFTVGGEVL